MVDSRYSVALDRVTLNAMLYRPGDEEGIVWKSWPLIPVRSVDIASRRTPPPPPRNLTTEAALSSGQAQILRPVVRRPRSSFLEETVVGLSGR
ncbi:hypothetical protein RRG08_049433 [Elysia crispata]|uniref:Uncharacterized protein n=1 Tax=Elysia crispata TaxID=231223 RepID=A0AAE1DL70_9GAST|nr:hypothetical protein RRG08_049433 [Elysia crispata]